MKKTFFSIALLVTVISSLSSCFVAHDRRGGHRGPGRDHGRDHDHHYERYNHQY